MHFETLYRAADAAKVAAQLAPAYLRPQAKQLAVRLMRAAAWAHFRDCALWAGAWRTVSRDVARVYLRDARLLREFARSL